MQSKLIVGDSLSVLDTYADYPASVGWVLKYRFVPRISGTAIQLTAVAEVDSYRITASSTTTASWIAGNYAWSKWVEKGTERQTLESGEIVFLPDPAQMAVGTDTRGHVEKVLANIEAMLEGKATKDVQEYTIADRQLKHYSIPELLVWRDRYKAQLANEKASAAGSKGLGRKIYMRF